MLLSAVFILKELWFKGSPPTEQEVRSELGRMAFLLDTHAGQTLSQDDQGQTPSRNLNNTPSLSPDGVMAEM